MNSTIIVSNLNVFWKNNRNNFRDYVKFLLANKIRIIVVEQNLDLIDDKDMLTQMILGCDFYDSWFRKRFNEFKN